MLRLLVSFVFTLAVWALGAQVVMAAESSAVR